MCVCVGMCLFMSVCMCLSNSVCSGNDDDEDGDEDEDGSSAKRMKMIGDDEDDDYLLEVSTKSMYTAYDKE